ncbi:MAG: helix-turn-helix transcriptional regulator [Gammaproteobacteria bacterium]
MRIKSKMTEKSLKQLEKIVGSKLTLGRLLWAIRTSGEIAQVDFAENLGITKQHLCDIEHGRKSISPKLAASYAQKLGFSEEQFIRLSLQEIVDREGLNILVEVTLKHSLNLHRTKRAHRSF